MLHKAASYDLARGASAILEELERQQIDAVFMVGRMTEEHPDVFQTIASTGHEIGLHGYEHDSLARYDAEAVAFLDKNLARVGRCLRT